MKQKNYSFDDFDVPLYSVKLAICFASDRDGIDKINDRYDVDISHIAWGSVQRGRLGDKSIVVLFMDLWDNEYPATYGVIAHECFHVTHEILDRIGHDADHSNSEPQAYLLGWVVNKVYEVLAKRKYLNKIKVIKEK